MARIPDSFIDEVLQRTDIVELINTRVPLKKAGRNYTACCPFHDEKTPSFSVSMDKQFYHCFGCQAGGNAVTFLMEYDGINFPQAIEELAQNAGLEVPKQEETKEQKARREQASTLVALMERADLFYQQQLRSAQERQPAVNYLKGRHITGQVAAQFGLGYAPPGYNNLMTHLSLNEQSLPNALAAGLLVRRDDSGRVYDKFRDRIMFPIRNPKGETIAFGGRLLGDGRPKYLNSPETPLFNKSRELYGLWEWRQSRNNSPRVFVVEGYMDVIAMAQHNISNVVATLGTATTSQHLTRLYRLVDGVVFCFDGDRAGRDAAWRALENALPVLEDGQSASFLFLPDGEDPDSTVRNLGREAFLALADEAMPLSEFLFDHLSNGHQLETIEKRSAFARNTAQYLLRMKDSSFKQLLCRELAALSQHTEDEIQQLMRAEEPAPKAPPAAIAAIPAQHEPPAHSSRDYDTSYFQETDSSQHSAPSFVPGRALTLAEQLILALITDPQHVHEMPFPEELSKLQLPHLDMLISVYRELKNNPNMSKLALQARLVMKHPSGHLEHLLNTTIAEAMDSNIGKRYWNDALLRLQALVLDNAVEEMLRQPTTVDAEKLKALLHQLSETKAKLNAPL